MARAFCVPGVVFLTCAFVLSLIVTISLPTIRAMDITRVHYGTTLQNNGSQFVSELRFGIWAYCFTDATNGDHICSSRGHGYTVVVDSPNTNRTVSITGPWTRGLAVHPVATIVIFFALLFSFSQHLLLTLIASLLAFLAALLTFIAFLIDIALFGHVKHDMNSLNIGARTITGPGFWITFATLILLLLGGCTVCFGRRRDAAVVTAPSARSSFFNRFSRRY